MPGPATDLLNPFSIVKNDNAPVLFPPLGSNLKVLMVWPRFPPSFWGFEGVLEVISSGPQLSLVALRYDNPDSSVFATTPVMALPQ